MLNGRGGAMRVLCLHRVDEDQAREQILDDKGLTFVVDACGFSSTTIHVIGRHYISPLMGDT